MNTQDEAVRRGNILWTIKERLETEAHIETMWCLQDIDKACKTIDEELGRFFSHFAGSHARTAATFGRMALETLEQVEYLRTVK